MPVFIASFVLAIVICIIVRQIYLDKLITAADEYMQGFSLLASCEKEYFPSAAREYAEQFEYKDKMEVQIIDTQGKVIVTTTGFEPSKAKMPDYTAALNSETNKAYRIYRSETGEKVLAQSEILTDYGYGSNGAVRYIISLKKYTAVLTFAYSIIIAVALGLLSFTAISGVFFIKSIAIPVRSVSAAARQIASGNFENKLEVERDDEIGELCDSINYMASELISAEKVKNDFISSVSHELRTPLTAIRGWGETAKMSIGTNEELVSKGLDVVLTESDRLSNLVEELLDFSRLQSGRLLVNMRPINVAPVLKEAADMYTELAKQHGIELIFTQPKSDSFVNGDPDRLKQVFINIIDNAVKYTKELGQVLVEIYNEDGCVRISVKDTGMGIPAKDVDRVKEKFFKAENSVRGSGIGLAVADEIIKQHQGLLFIESTEGVGTSVSIVLPEIIPETPEVKKIIPPTDAVDTLQNEDINKGENITDEENEM